MRAILPLALLAAAACYTPRAVEPTPDAFGLYGSGQGWGAEPLEASLFYDEYTGYAYFDLSRPAHVSLFALRPGGGLTMIYPRIGVGSRMSFTAGRNIIRTAGSPYTLTGNWSVVHGQGPMYILLVASDDPLDVSAFRATGTMPWLNRSAITWNPHVALEALVGEIVPRPNTSAWTTAMHVVWPYDPGIERNRVRYVRVRCASGVEVVVPMAAVLAGYPVCPEDLRQTPPPDSAGGEKTEKTRQAMGPVERHDPPDGWMTDRVAGVDLRKELKRLRDAHGRRDPGELTVRPFPAVPGPERARPASPRERSPSGSSWQGLVGKPAAAPRPRPSRPEARPAPSRPSSSRPAARPSRPVTGSKPSAPSRPSKPKPKPKPKPSGGGSG